MNKWDFAPKLIQIIYFPYQEKGTISLFFKFSTKKSHELNSKEQVNFLYIQEFMWLTALL